MTSTLTLVIYTAILTWVALLGASLIRARGWTLPGMMVAMGNRDNLPDATALAARADRTARNTVEGFILFAAIALTAHAANRLQTLGLHWGRNSFSGRVFGISQFITLASLICARWSGRLEWLVWP